MDFCGLWSGRHHNWRADSCAHARSPRGKATHVDGLGACNYHIRRASVEARDESDDARPWRHLALRAVCARRAGAGGRHRRVREAAVSAPAPARSQDLSTRARASLLQLITSGRGTRCPHTHTGGCRSSRTHQTKTEVKGDPRLSPGEAQATPLTWNYHMLSL